MSHRPGAAPRQGMRADIAGSWLRSAAAGVGVDQVAAPLTLPTDELRDVRAAHPLARVLPLLEDVVGRAARESDAIMAVSDAAGQLLWVSGTSSTLRRAEDIGFVEGSNWDERVAGTNAPGLVLRLDRPATVSRIEHFRHSVRPWSCAASPIHDPVSSDLLGVLDITGGDQVMVPQTLGMVRAAARLAEAELARESLVADTVPEHRGPGVRLDLEVLGRPDALLTISDGRGRPARLRLSRRHSELLVLLTATPGGLMGGELAVLLYEHDVPGATLRAEINRLRQLIGEDVLLSRPYRLAAEVRADWMAIEAQLSTGDLAAAVRGYRGPLLGRSCSPGVVRLREELAHSVRSALLASGQPDLMSAWTRSSWGGDDYEMWQRQREVVGERSPMRPLIDGQIGRLDRELGAR